MAQFLIRKLRKSHNNELQVQFKRPDKFKEIAIKQLTSTDPTPNVSKDLWLDEWSCRNKAFREAKDIVGRFCKENIVG